MLLCNRSGCEKLELSSRKKCIECRIKNRESQAKRRSKSPKCELGDKKFFNRVTIMDKISSYKSSDRAKGFDLNNYIDVDFIILLKEIFTYCPYCTEKIQYDYERYSEKQFSIDRIRNDMAHLKGNVIVCCLNCNKRRGDKSQEEFKIYIEQMNIYKK